MEKTESSVTLVSKLDASDPLYLHASDSSGLTVVNIKLKGTENYVVWSNAMKLALMAKNKLGFIDGSCKRSTTDEVLASQWDRCNSIVLTWILNSVSDELYVGQVYSKLASEVWDDLKETYDKVDGSVVFGLFQKINSVSQNGTSVSEYYHRINTMWKQFDAMLQLPSCTCQASTKFNEFNQLIKLMQFLMGLDDIYQPVRTNLLTRDPLPTVKTAFSIISREESHRDSNSSSKVPNVGFAAKTNQFNDNKKRFNKGPNPNLKCTHCNKIGHVVDKCFELHGYPSNFRPRPNQNNNQWSKPNNTANHSVSDKSVSNSLNSLTSKQFSKLLGLLGEKKIDDGSKTNVGGFVLKENPGDWTPSSVLNGRSPYELLFGFEPSLSHLKIFGCLCFFTVLNNPDKLDQRAEKCIFMGYSNLKKGYKVWSLDQKKFIFSRDVSFHENVLPYKTKVFSKSDLDNTEALNNSNFFDLYDSSSDINPDDDEKVETDSATVTQQHSSSNESTPPVDTQQPSSADGMAGNQQVYESETNPVRAESSSSNEESNLPEGTHTTTRKSTRSVSVPKKFGDYVVEGKVKFGYERVVNYANLPSDNICFASNVNKILEPSSYQEAIKDSNWVNAMNEELSALHSNNTWSVVDLPKGRKPIGCKWIFRVKYKSNGEVERYKARLVAKGFNQREGIDFDETFSPVVKMVTVTCIVSLSVQNDWPLYQLDVNNAFLYGNLKEEVYMSMPEGLNDSHPNKVCKLNKSLYGLKQAPRMWNEKLVNVLLKIGFCQSKCDYSMFIKSDENVFVVMLVYVDDIILTGNSKQEIDNVKNLLQSEFKIKDLGLLKFFSRN
ncbi:putative RNA-directed DNA polymerase [Helianthus annuus]|nr:putative RNA-directed DNA polymerase [Helianthus annuus]